MKSKDQDLLAEAYTKILKEESSRHNAYDYAQKLKTTFTPQSIQQGKNFDQTVHDILKTSIELTKNREIKQVLSLWSEIRKIVHLDIYTELLRSSIQSSNINKEIKNEFRNLVLPTLRKFLGKKTLDNSKVPSMLGQTAHGQDTSWVPSDI